MAKRDSKGRFIKENPFEKNKHEIKYNLINSLLAGGMVFIGTIADGKVSWVELLASFAAAGVVALIKFKEYWAGQKSEYAAGLFTWI